MYRIAEYRYGSVRIGISIESKVPVYDTYRKPVRSPTLYHKGLLFFRVSLIGLGVLNKGKSEVTLTGQ